MAQWFKEYWYLAVIFVVVCIIAGIIFRFAAKSYKNYRTAYRNQEKEIKRLVALKERFVPLTKEAILSSDEDILEGTALSYQLFLQKQDNIEEAFSLLEKEKQYIYILDVFVSDGSCTAFFKENSDILRMKITEALKLIGMVDFAKKAEEIRKMFDLEDESTSFDVNKIKQADEYIAENNILFEIRKNGGQYIKNNYVTFVN